MEAAVSVEIRGLFRLHSPDPVVCKIIRFHVLIDACVHEQCVFQDALEIPKHRRKNILAFYQKWDKVISSHLTRRIFGRKNI